MDAAKTTPRNVPTYDKESDSSNRVIKLTVWSWAVVGNLWYDFSGRTAIVTGAAHGIGRALGQFFVLAGATTYLVDSNGDELGRAAVEAGGRAIIADMGSTEDVTGVVAIAVEETGRVDILVNNAGMLRGTALWQTTDADWERVFAVHAGGTFRFTRACVPRFKGQRYGRVVNVTPYIQPDRNGGHACFATAKAGIIGFTMTAARELANLGVTVNAISPSVGSGVTAAAPREVESTITTGDLPEVTEVCATVAFLASEEARHVTGVVLPVDGQIPHLTVS